MPSRSFCDCLWLRGLLCLQYVNLEGVPHPKKSGKEGAISLPKFTLILGDTVHVLKDQNPVRARAERALLSHAFSVLARELGLSSELSPCFLCDCLTL